jgi:hypothetical protein
MTGKASMTHCGWSRHDKKAMTKEAVMPNVAPARLSSVPPQGAKQRAASEVKDRAGNEQDRPNGQQHDVSEPPP